MANGYKAAVKKVRHLKADIHELEAHLFKMAEDYRQLKKEHELLKYDHAQVDEELRRLKDERHSPTELPVLGEVTDQV